MRISMKRLVAGALLAALTVVATTSPRQAAGANRTASTEISSSGRALQGETAPELVGTGIAAKLACMACAGTLLAATGTGSIAALIMVVGANPELASACVVGCIAAFS